MLRVPGQGPYRYRFASHGRNYHNWDWDTTDPDNIPQFDRMVPAGSNHFGELPGLSGRLAQTWNNWDAE